MKKGLVALSPLMVFVAFYLVTSIIAGDFYKVPITVAFMVSSIYAIAVLGGKPLMSRINAFSRGAATEQMMLMIWIFILAGAFAHSAKAMGCIDATVQRGYDSGLGTYRGRYCLGDWHRRGTDDSHHCRWLVLWRQPLFHI